MTKTSNSFEDQIADTVFEKIVSRKTGGVLPPYNLKKKALRANEVLEKLRSAADAKSDEYIGKILDSEFYQNVIIELEKQDFRSKFPSRSGKDDEKILAVKKVAFVLAVKEIIEHADFDKEYKAHCKGATGNGNRKSSWVLRTADEVAGKIVAKGSIITYGSTVAEYIESETDISRGIIASNIASGVIKIIQDKLENKASGGNKGEVFESLYKMAIEAADKIKEEVSADSSLVDFISTFKSILDRCKREGAKKLFTEEGKTYLNAALYIIATEAVMNHNMVNSEKSDKDPTVEQSLIYSVKEQLGIKLDEMLAEKSPSAMRR